MFFLVMRITASSVLPSPAVPPVFSSVSRFASYRASISQILFCHSSQLVAQTICSLNVLSICSTHSPLIHHHYPPLCTHHLSLFSCTSSPNTHACILSSSLAAFLISSLSSTLHCSFFVFHHLILVSVYTTYEHTPQALNHRTQDVAVLMVPGIEPMTL